MRQRLDLAEAMLCERAHLSNVDEIRQEVMAEFEIVLTQIPYVGGAASRMSDFFMRLIGFMAIGRVLRRHGVATTPDRRYRARNLQGAIAYRARSRTSRLGPSIHVASESNFAARASDKKPQREEYPEDFVYDFVEPGPADNFDFGIDYKACGFCKFAARHRDREIFPNICGLDFDAYATRGIRLERTQTVAGGASYCNFRFSRLPSD